MKIAFKAGELMKALQSFSTLFKGSNLWICKQRDITDKEYLLILLIIWQPAIGAKPSDLLNYKKELMFYPLPLSPKIWSQTGRDITFMHVDGYYFVVTLEELF